MSLAGNVARNFCMFRWYSRCFSQLVFVRQAAGREQNLPYLHRTLCAVAEVPANLTNPFQGKMGELHEQLTSQLKTKQTIKSFNMVKLFSNISSKEQFEAALNLLKLFRLTRSVRLPLVALRVVDACVKLDEPERAVEILDDKAQYGLQPGHLAYVRLLDTLLDKCPLTSGRANAAARCFCACLKDGLQPSALLTSLGIVAYCAKIERKDHRFQRAKSLFTDWCATEMVKLLPVAYESLMRAALYYRRSKYAIALYHQLEKDGLCQGMYAYNLYVRAMSKTLPGLKSALDQMELDLSDEETQRRIEHDTLLFLWDSVRKNGSSEVEVLQNRLKKFVGDLKEKDLIVKDLGASFGVPCKHLGLTSEEAEQALTDLLGES